MIRKRVPFLTEEHPFVGKIITVPGLEDITVSTAAKQKDQE